MIRTLIQVTSLVLSGAAFAAPTADADATASFVAAYGEFDRGRHGDHAALDRAHEQFRQLSGSDPANPVFLAYYGSTFTLLGGAASAPLDKLRLTEKGLGLLDRAVKMLKPPHDQARTRGVPMAIETRLLAAGTFLAVPPMFKRFEAGKALVAEALASPAFEASPVPMKTRLFQLTATVAQKEGQKAAEKDALRHVVALAPQDPGTEAARNRLKELGE